MRPLAIVAIGLLSFTTADIAAATETVTYTYDARGRVVKAERSGTVNNGVTSEYEYDKATNRKRVKVTGSPNPPP